MKLEQARFEAAFGTFAQLPPSSEPEIAFSGRSNVGKSSLLNKVLGRKSLARVSSKPGKTITINFYEAGGVRLCDLPGYGYAKVAFQEKKRWAEMMEGYFRSGRDIRLVVQLIDMRHAPTQDDLDMLAFLRESGYPFVVAMTKCDKLNKTEYQLQRDALSGQLAACGAKEVFPFSAVTGEGVDQIRAALADAVNDKNEKE